MRIVLQRAMTNTPDLEAFGDTKQLLEAEEFDKYSWILLEDHPLRSYPAERNCHPDITALASRCTVVARRCWREYGQPLLCLVVMIFLVVRLLLQLPYTMSYFLQSAYDTSELPGFIQTLEPANQAFAQATTCIYDSSSQTEGAPHDALKYALASGCTGVKVDVWPLDHDLLVENPRSSVDNEHTLRRVYIESLYAQLYVRNSAFEESSTEHHHSAVDTLPIGLFDEDPLQTFTLFLDVQTPMRRAWPLLVAQLKILNDSGYLSYRNAEQGLVMRPITVVVSEKACRRLSLVNDLWRAMKGLF